MERKSLAAVEQQAQCSDNQARCSDNQARCSDQHQHLGFPNLRQLIAERTKLAAASAPYLNQPNHKSQRKIYYSQTEPTRYSETHTHCYEFSQHQRIIKSSLLVVAGSNLTAVSAQLFHQISMKS